MIKKTDHRANGLITAQAFLVNAACQIHVQEHSKEFFLRLCEQIYDKVEKESAELSSLLLKGTSVNDLIPKKAFKSRKKR